MSKYIRENIKMIIVMTALVVLTLALVGSNEILAKNLPSISEYHVIQCNIEDETYAYGYTGKEINPKISRVVLADAEGNVQVFYGDDISSVQYLNNTKVGSVDAKITFAGYQDSLLAKDVFTIVPEAVSKFEVTPESREEIKLTWEKVENADGYHVYRSINGTEEYQLLGTVASEEELVYSDKDMHYHALFYYYVSAFVELDGEVYEGIASEVVVQATPLETPRITSLKSVTHTSVLVQWGQVDGATGYQVYRSESKKGEFKKIAEIEDGTKTSYTDSKGECGKEYFYYITARQTIDEQHVFGEASVVMSVTCAPNIGTLSGSVTGGTKVTLKWKATTGAQGYELYKSVGNASSFQLVKKIEKNDEISWSEEGLEKTKSYYYRVRAYCVVGEKVIYGSYSNSYCKHAMIDYNYTPGSSLDFLRQYVGVKYFYGGTSPTAGWDCSGFTQWVYKNYFGMTIGRTAASQYNGGTAISLTDRASWKPGDLLLYRSNNGKGSIGHVAIYLGGGEIIHAIIPKTMIHSVDRYETMDSNTLVAVRRYLP